MLLKKDGFSTLVANLDQGKGRFEQTFGSRILDENLL